MGIRINKAMGYAWDKVPAGNNITEWINEHEGVHVRDFLIHWREHAHQLKDIFAWNYSNPFLTFENSLIDLNIKIYKEETLDKELIKYIKFDPESGLENVLLLIPPGSEDWERRDDIIDYHECSIYHPENPGEPRLTKLYNSDQTSFGEPRRTGIYPYNYRKPPITIAAMCVYMGYPNMFRQLEEAIYTWWS
jgi:hypothetical protein